LAQLPPPRRKPTGPPKRTDSLFRFPPLPNFKIGGSPDRKHHSVFPPPLFSFFSPQFFFSPPQSFWPGSGPSLCHARPTFPWSRLAPPFQLMAIAPPPFFRSFPKPQTVTLRFLARSLIETPGPPHPDSFRPFLVGGKRAFLFFPHPLLTSHLPPPVFQVCTPVPLPIPLAEFFLFFWEPFAFLIFLSLTSRPPRAPGPAVGELPIFPPSFRRFFSQFFPSFCRIPVHFVFVLSPRASLLPNSPFLFSCSPPSSIRTLFSFSSGRLFR